MVLKKKDELEISSKLESSSTKPKHFPIKFTHNKTLHNLDYANEYNQTGLDSLNKPLNPNFFMSFNSEKIVSPNTNPLLDVKIVDIDFSKKCESKMESNRQRKSGTNLTLVS